MLPVHYGLNLDTKEDSASCVTADLVFMVQRSLSLHSDLSREGIDLDFGSMGARGC